MRSRLTEKKILKVEAPFYYSFSTFIVLYLLHDPETRAAAADIGYAADLVP